MKTRKQMKKAIKEGRIHPTKGYRKINLNKQEKWAQGNANLALFWWRFGVRFGA